MLGRCAKVFFGMSTTVKAAPTSDPSRSLLNSQSCKSNANAQYGTNRDEPRIDSSGRPDAPEEKTTVLQEIKILGANSAPLIVTYLLQYGLSIITISLVGHLGTNELAAVALALMTANITGFAVYEGLITGLDTLCAQAYGAGRLDLVGLHVQRMSCLLLLITIPISVLWILSPQLLVLVIPEKDLARMAGYFLRASLLGAPGYALFEAGRRFSQAQGLFYGPLFVILMAIPINIFFNWLLVFRFQWGFIGAALALSITRDILPILLLAYVIIIEPSSLKCWVGIGKEVFQDWGVMIKLSLPGVFMVQAEWFAFEILTVAASYLSSIELAAQSVIMTVCVVVAHVTFSVSVAISVRLGNLIGSNRLDAAKVATKAYCIAAVVVGLIDGILVILLRQPILRAFTADEAVIGIASRIMPVLAIHQLFDSTTAMVNGLLRGLGRQSTGAWINLLVYYLVSLQSYTELLLHY